jgi:hypothetical protein
LEALLMGGAMRAMKLDGPSASDYGYLPLIAAPPLLIATWLCFAPFNHDNAWLLEATRRWVGGAELYREIIEINPPLIFIENVLLTAGLLTKTAYLFGVAASILISAFWVARAISPRAGLVVSLALSLPAIQDFGQRDHLALIFLVPFVLCGSRLTGAWAFLGVALKPYFAFIPAASLGARCWQARNLSPLGSLEAITLVGLCLAWVAAVALIWPRYFTYIVPLARHVYSAFGVPIGPFELLLLSLSAAIALFVSLRQQSLLPLAAACLGASVSFLLQGRFWTYHLIPTLGLTVICVSLATLREAGAIRAALALASTVLLAMFPLLGPRQYDSFVPAEASSVLFLSENVARAYPAAFECSVTNTSSMPTYWTLPGAWNTGNTTLFREQVAAMNSEIRDGRPSVIMEDLHMAKFQRPFVFKDWADLGGYRYEGHWKRYRVWVRRDLPTLSRRACP